MPRLRVALPSCPTLALGGRRPLDRGATVARAGRGDAGIGEPSVTLGVCDPDGK